MAEATALLDTGITHLLPQIGADIVNMSIDSTRCKNEFLASDYLENESGTSQQSTTFYEGLGQTHFGRRPNDHILGDAVHNIRVPSFADTDNIAVLDPDISLW